MPEILIAGGGIGGLATALALQRMGLAAELWEQAPAWGEVGAGIQLGPNVTRILQAWGLTDELNDLAAHPQVLIARDATQGQVLGQLHLSDMPQRYGAPYLTVHRADLHGLLLRALDTQQVSLHLNRATHQISIDSHQVQVQDQNSQQASASVLVGADGLWSQVRSQVWQDTPPQATGHWAYRSLLPMGLLPSRWREPNIQVWMAKGLHAVHYPVRRGQWLNVVVLVEGDGTEQAQGWDVQRPSEAIAADVKRALRGLCPDLHDVLRPIQDWRAWPLYTRPPLQSASDMARGPVSLIGDAAHPMLPYMAQGAGMAIEDAQALAQCLRHNIHSDLSAALQSYAHARWARNARVQALAQRNATVFHASGLMASARNLAMRLAAPQLMDQPWLYASG